MTKPAVFRFAPSPNGELHLGHALSALIGYERAHRAGGRFLLRIEDIDVSRSRPQFVAGIFEDLRWLGLTWEEPVLFQSQRLPAYSAAAGRLAAMGLLYPCFATRAEIEAAAAGGPLDPDGAPLYPGLYRHRSGADIARLKASGAPFAQRIDMRACVAAARAKLAGAPFVFTELAEDDTPQIIHVQPEQWGDAVIIRKDVPASYHLAVVVDDAWQGVTHVTRGRDLFAATHIHRLLQVLLDLPEPLYHHHRLITDESGRKLAKSARDTSLRSLREQGVTPADIRRLVGLA
ncbi:MAG: tRNA glutamyl-Q(34) synthetase GluQRS [Hyphomicrobiaceae bacterium]|nr:MAG: tRNA glutamyl-Q(34) synthetase GluQRS [Hyphomicrobiaceae bacterium]